MSNANLHTSSCACCAGLLAARYDRRRFLHMTAAAGLAAAMPSLALAAKGQYDAMLLTCIDPRFPAPTRRGDRVVVKTKRGEVMVKELRRKTTKSIELKSLNAEHQDRTLQMSDVLWVARIMWASQ